MPPYFVQIKIIQVPELQLDGGGEGGRGGPYSLGYGSGGSAKSLSSASAEVLLIHAGRHVGPAVGYGIIIAL